MKSSRFLVFPLLLVAAVFFPTICSADQATSKASPGLGAAAQRQGLEGSPPPDLSEIKPMPQLKVAPPEDGFKRRVPLPTPRPRDFGTVTKEIDGGVSTTPVSPAVERALKKRASPNLPYEDNDSKLRGAPDPSAQPKVERGVIGEDDRVRIRNTTTYPFSAIGLLIMEFSNDAATCTGTLIGTHYVLTAAHCLYSPEYGEWANNVKFCPGFNGAGNAPYGCYEASHLHALSGFVDAGTGSTFTLAHIRNDLGIVKLRKAAGNRLGWLAFGYNDDLPRFVAHIVGYPGDKRPPYSMWRASCETDPEENIDLDLLTHDCDITPGSSGSSIYDFDKQTKSRTIYAVVSAESASVNFGVRIGASYFCWLREKMGDSC